MRGLPLDSGTAQALDPAVTWTTDTALLALLAELVDQSNRLFLSANRRKGARIPDPLRIPRPWVKRADRPRVPSEVRQLAAGVLTIQPEEG